MKKDVIVILLLMLIPIVCGTELTLSPSINSFEVGENFTINILLNNNESIYGIDLRINKIPEMELLNYEFLSRTNNSMTNVIEEDNRMRFGILFSPDTNGLAAGNDAIIRLKYKANEEAYSQLMLTNVFLSDKNGQEIQTNIQGAEINITNTTLPLIPEITLRCTGDYGYKGEKIKIPIYINVENTNIGGIDFSQSFDTNIKYTTTSKTTETNEGMLVTNPETNKIRIALAGINLTGDIHILDIEYEILSSKDATTTLEFKDLTISDTEGILITTSNENNCIIEIMEEITSPSSPSTGGGSGGGSSGSANTYTPTKKETPKTNFDYYSSLTGSGTTETKKETKEPVFFTQTNEKEEKTETTEEETKIVSSKLSKRTVPIAIIALTALIGLGIMVVGRGRGKRKGEKKATEFIPPINQ